MKVRSQKKNCCAPPASAALFSTSDASTIKPLTQHNGEKRFLLLLDDGAAAFSSNVNTGILNETVLMLVFRSLNWYPRVLSVAACVSRRLRAVVRRVLFRELCISRAPRMVASLTADGAAPGGRIGGGWHALTKLLFYCCGCMGPTRFFALGKRAPIPGHYVGVSRFSKTSGQSFLARRCWGDLLYISDPCEHQAGEGENGCGGQDLGTYRGVFRGFKRSRTRAWLLGKRAELETRARCPYCGVRVWSMTAAGLVPRSASRRLGTREGRLEYFVCVNGHLHGYSWLAHLSTDDEEEEGNEEEEEDYDEVDEEEEEEEEYLAF